jgi:hypothetical protein
VSYDLTFAIVRPGQTLVEAVDALGEQAHHTHELDPAVWDRVLISAREVLGKVDEFASANHRELTHEPTGLQVTYSGWRSESPFHTISRERQPLPFSRWLTMSVC